MATVTQPSNYLGVFTWAQVAALTTYPVGTTAFVTDWGITVAWTGTRWRPAGNLTIASAPDVGQTTGAGNTTENALAGCSLAIPAGLVKSQDLWHILVSGEKNAAVETAALAFRFGTAGSVADGALSPTIAWTAASRTIGYEKRLRVNGITNVRKIGGGANASLTDWAGLNTGIRPGADSPISSMLANNNFLTLTCAMSAGTEFISISLFSLTITFVGA
jgi:hypothetical protein